MDPEGQGSICITIYAPVYYAVFAELVRDITKIEGRTGVIVPTGVATDDTTKYYFQALVDDQSLVSLYDFENRNGIFPGVHRSYKFCMLTLRGGKESKDTGRVFAPAEFVFFALNVADLNEPEKRFSLNAEDIQLLNPNTRTCPIFRSQRDAELTKAIYRRASPLIVEEEKEGRTVIRPEINPWKITFKQGLFNMTSDSGLFRTKQQLEQGGWKSYGNSFERDAAESYVPLFEGRLGHQFNHRYAIEPNGDLFEISTEQLQDPFFFVETQYFVPISEAKERLGRRKVSCDTGILGFRRVTNNTNERTSVACIFPWGAASYGWIMSFGPDAVSLCLLHGIFNSLSFDYVLRNSLNQPSIPVGTYKQVAAPVPSDFDNSWRDFVTIRVLELTYTAWDLAPFAEDVIRDWGSETGDSASDSQSPIPNLQSPLPPFRWDEERRFLLRCELDAAFFHLYDIHRDDVDYILETFPIVKRKDEAAHGEYRTKRVILEIYDEMARSMRTGRAYQTRLDPPPADARVCHPGRGEG